MLTKALSGDKSLVLVDHEMNSASEHFADWPPERTVFPLKSIQLKITETGHPLVIPNSVAIDAHWHEETKANPSLFDGRMLLMSSLVLEDNQLSGVGHITPYSAFLWWRKRPQRLGAVHVFAYAVIASSDGALIAIRMASHTANAGQVYFAAGSLEPEDVRDGICDLYANMSREVKEETGLDLADAQAGDRFYACHLNHTVPIFKVYRFDMTADEIVYRITKHMAVAEDKEIAGAVAIRSADPAAFPYNVSMLPIIDWYFSAAK